MWPFPTRKARARVARRMPRPSFRPRSEQLEDRCLLSAGALDPTFNPSGSPPGTATVAINALANAGGVLVQPSGKIVVTGDSSDTTSPVQYQHFNLAEFDPNGSLDSNFGSGGTVATSSNGKIVAAEGGGATLYPTGSPGDEKILEVGFGYDAKSGASGFVLVRFNPDGSLDTSFGQGGMVLTQFKGVGTNGASGVILQPNGTSLPKIVVGGSTNTGIELARYNPDGSLDTTFGSRGTVYTPIATSGWVAAGLGALDPVTGDLLVGGLNETNQSGPAYGLLAAYKANGTLDASFGNNGLVTGSSVPIANALAVYPATAPDGNAGKIVTVGSGVVARYNVAGTLDTTWGGSGEVSDPFGGPYAMTIQSDGKVVLGGSALARYDANGGLDGTFGTAGIVTTAFGVGALALQPNGDIIAAGKSFTGSYALGGSTSFAVARYLPSSPEIGSFTASPDPVTSGSNTTLTASNISDRNPGTTVTQVAIYLDSNGDGQLEPGTDRLLGYATQISPGVWTFTWTVSPPPGTYTLFAQAQDSYGVLGDSFALNLAVQ
jgi:uncharacterized delta-60 repeat protein